MGTIGLKKPPAHDQGNQTKTFMSNSFRKKLTCMLGALIIIACSSLQAAPNKTEDQLIQMLRSGDYHTINDALDRLPHWCPNSTNAIEIIRGMLRSNEVLVVTDPVYETAQNGSHTRTVTFKRCSPTIIARMAARSLGNYHATLSEEELNVIYKLFNSRDEDTTMDALKALRGLNAPQAVPKIIPLLDDKSIHVVRDAIRTLAVLGDKSTIPYIEPLTKEFRSDIRWDAIAAVKKLQEKP
jgi:hypothetical protein